MQEENGTEIEFSVPFPQILLQLDQQIFGIDLRTCADMGLFDDGVPFCVNACFHFHRFNRQQ